jgi:hypothetical protein
VCVCSLASDLKLTETQSITATLRQVDPYTEVVTVASPEALAALRDGYSLPQHLGLEVVASPHRGSTAASAAVTLCDEFDPATSLHVVNSDLLTTRAEQAVDKGRGGSAAGGGGAGGAGAAAGAGGTAGVATLLHAAVADLTSPEAFEQLFRLLTVDVEVGRVVWQILQLLPTNPVKITQLRDIERLREAKWDSLLDSSGTYPLVYSLQILDGLLQGSGDSPSARRSTSRGSVSAVQMRRVEWTRAFMRLGGLRHLTRLLLTACSRSDRGGGDGGDRVADGARPSLLAYLFRLVHALLALDAHYVNVDVFGVGTAAGRTDVPVSVPSHGSGAGGAVSPGGAGGGAATAAAAAATAGDGGKPLMYSLQWMSGLVDVADGTLVCGVDLPAIVHAVISGMLDTARVLRSSSKGGAARHGSSSGGVGDSATGSERFAGSSVAFYGMHLLVACLLSRADCLPALAAHPKFRQWLKHHMLHAPAPARFAVAQGIARLCRYLPHTVSSAAPFAAVALAIPTVLHGQQHASG